MSEYLRDNGKGGLQKVIHTATGYECPAIICDNEDCCKDIKFFAKKIVSLKGKVFTEIGFYSNETFNMQKLAEKITKALVSYGLNEVTDIDHQPKNSMSFQRYKTAVKNMVEFRICGGDDGILIAFYALKDFIHPEAKEFVQQQELEVDNILYHSLMQNLGEELMRGPGGSEYAEKRCRELASILS